MRRCVPAPAFARASRELRLGRLLLAACVLASLPADAQVLTGALVGTVKDEHGAVLPGALVRVTSPALIGGPATTTTNERGQLRFPILPPGTYALDIELAGFATYHEADVTIGAGATIERTVVLKLAGVAESVVVEGSGSRIEARSSGFETRFKAEDFQAIPTRRFSMIDFIRAAPGVSPTSPSSGSDQSINAAASPASVSAFGSGTNENLFLIDGTNFTCPCSGGGVAEPGVDFIQELQVQSVGASAEYGNMQGAVFNVITKQGGNRLVYDAAYYAQTPRLTSQPIVLPVSRGSRPASGYERISYRDFTTNLGGPVRRDRIWFFAGYQYLRDYDSQPGTDPAFPRTYEQDKVFAKLTWQLKPGLQLLQSYHHQFWSAPERATLVKPFEATLRQHASVPAITFGHLTQTLNDSTVWDVRVGRFVSARVDDPSSGDPTIPGRSDNVTGVSSGAPQQIGAVTLIRTTAKATLSHYQPGLFAADHQWKIGGQVEIGEHSQAQVIPTGTRFVDSNGQPFQAVSRAPAVSGGQFITTSAFASDSLTVRDRITINAGLRFDHSRAISQDVHSSDAAGRETDEIVAGLGTLYTWNVWSPRLGLTAKISATGRTMLRATYGRFNQGVLTGELAPIHPSMTPITTMAFDSLTGAYTRPVSIVDTSNLRLDPNTRTPCTDEYSIGLDREVSRRLAIALAYVHKDGSKFIAWTDTGGQYRREIRTLADGRTLPVFALVNAASDRRFLMTNPDGYGLTYNGLVMAVEKRRSRGWQAFGSYTFSRVYGLQASSGTTAAGAQNSSGLSTGTFGRDPNDLTDADGRLPNDRPHMFRAMGTIEVPRMRFTVGASFQYFSGKPWAATTQEALPQGSQRVLLEPRGSRRLSSQSLLDVRVSRSIPFGRGRHVEILFDVLNVLNDTAEESLATDNLFSPNFGRPSIFIDPRRAMIGMRLTLGQP
jgi:Carboxypeptidase regulatory-like domain/TonB dependent receptor-like, beta-barrel